MFKKETCQLHIWKSLSFLCSCGTKLCPHCIKGHYHEKMVFTSIPDIYLTFLQKLQNLKNITSLYYAATKKKSLDHQSVPLLIQMTQLEKLSAWIDKYIENKENLYKLSIEEIDSFNKENIIEKVIDMARSGMSDYIEENDKKIDTLIGEEATA